MATKLLSRLALMLLLGVLLIFTSYLLAQDTAPTAITGNQVSLEFYGTVQTANAVALAINGQVIALDNAQIDAALTPGMVVRVQAIILPDGTITAQRVSAVPVGVLPGIVEFTGILEAVGDASILVSGQIIGMGEFAFSSQFQVGDSVRLYAISETQGTWTLRGIISLDQIPPLATPDPSAPISTPIAPAPVVTQEVSGGSGSVVQPPVTTPDVGDDNDNDNGNDNDDNSGRGGGDNDGGGGGGGDNDND